ncbi:MAG: hypothetical protein IJ091_02215 [Oscillospiraceae bacterium]|nr:hypothetical protein [Oscillospiraceae bacterium]
MKFEVKLTLPGSKYANNFGFRLKCSSCGDVSRELGTNAYTAETELNRIRRSGEKCPVCGASTWEKVRIIQRED